MYHLRKLKSLLLLLLIAVTAKAQLESGKVYNFVNVGNSDKSMTSATAGNYLSIATTNQEDYSQLWYADEVATDVYTLRNLGNGNYLRSPNAGGNTNWTLVKTVDGDNCKFSCTQVSGHDVLRAINTTDSYHYMHYGATTGTIVCWESDAAATQWDFTEVSGITAVELAANWNAIAAINPNDDVIATYRTALDELFADEACTTLEGTYASMDETTLKNQAAYNNLPTTLQDMVLKVRNDSWGEDNIGGKPAWDAAYAKKYRVQLYEPYNEPEAAASALGLNAHTNLNNPTGIFSGGREAIYVMVEGEIEEGASLYLASYSGHGKLGGFSNGVELKQGLNVVPAYSAGNNYCINYVVHTFDTSDGKKGNKAKVEEYRLSNYSDLKIHIEGGHINGYWNKMGDYRQTGIGVLYTPDTNADWDYIAARATQTDVTVLGEYITLQFPLHEALDNEGKTQQGLGYYYTGKDIIEASIDEWDKVMMWERFLLGVASKEATTNTAKNPKSPYSENNHVVEYTGDDGDDFATDYGDYYNVHGLSFGTPHGYMYGGWDHCGYHFNTMGAIMTTMINDAGTHWGPAHEIGHQHQGLLTVNGLTEVTNNLFSNVVLWYFGESTSRVNGSDGSLSNVLAAFNTEGSDFFTNNIWGLTHMYYKLFLYYHVLGHNPKFYPRLFEMLRQEPMSGGYTQNGATSLLHFYKKCCLASGDDLTEFFRAHGFFSVMDNRLVGDYANSVYTTTQKDIDDAIEEVKELGYDENIAVIFINDATGDDILSHKGNDKVLTPYQNSCAEVGSYATFEENTTPDYIYTVVGNTVTMEGEGGTGFAIFNENGEIIAFSDKKTFEISNECAVAIASGKAVLKAVTAENETVEAVDLMDTDDVDAKYAKLGELLESAEALLALNDDSGKKVGFYREASLTKLDAAYDAAKTVYDNRTVASYVAVYDVLSQEYVKLMNDDYACIGLVEGNAYRMENKNYAGRLMTVNSGTNVMSGLEEYKDTTDLQKWYFEASATEGRYYIKNKSTGKYVADAKVSTAVIVDKTKEEAQTYKLQDMGNGLWAIVGSSQNLHNGAGNYSYNVLGWGDNNAAASQWYITAVELDDAAENLYDLKALIDKTEALIDEVGEAKKIKLQATDPDAPYYLYCNALYNKSAGSNDGDNSMNTAKLLDGNPDTHIHTDYRTNGYVADDALDHYLRVDMGQGNTITKFKFTYTTRNAGDSESHPKTIVVAGANDLNADDAFTTIVILPETGTLPGANTNNGGSGVYTSSEITCAPYRYIRFMVTETQGSNKQAYGGHPYFYMAEFNLLVDSDVKVDNKYATEITVDELTNAFNSLLSAQEVVEDADASQYETAYTALDAHYQALLTAKNTVESAKFDELKEELDALMSRTTTLIESCGTVTYTPGTFNGKAKLQTTEADDDFYVSTNAQEADEGPISNLVDGDKNTYFHSDYSGENSTDELDHHITINLGESNKAKDFRFKYITRHNGDTNYPTAITIYGSVGGEIYEEITSVTENLPTEQSATYESALIEAGKYYSHLRFMVTANNNTNTNNGIKGGHPIFHMAEFELDIVGISDSYTAELGEGAGDAGEDLLIETFKQNAEAKGVYSYATTELQVTAAIAELQAQYDKLYAEQQSNKKAELRDLVALTTTLIDECGTLTYVESTASVALQATNDNEANYLSCPNLYNPNNVTTNDNTDGDVDYNCDQLLDSNTDTYIHTNYNAATSTYPHYLQVAFGSSEVPEQFKFTYTTRSQGANQVPKHIIVKGSNDGVNFNDTLGVYDYQGTNALPTSAGTKWTAPEYLTGGYAYLRFYVTASPANTVGATNTTTPFFSMSEFGMFYTGYAIKWNDAQHGTATNAQLIAAYEARNAANELLATTTTKDALQATTTALQAKYTELYNAKNSIQYVDFNISSNVTGGGVEYNEVEYTGTLNAPSTLTAGELTAMDVEGYVAKSVTIDGTTISVIYNKVYTVQVVGVDAAAGGVELGEESYAGGATFDMLESEFNIENFTTIPVTGYAPYKTFDGTTITVTYKKIYTVQVTGGEGEGRVTFGDDEYANEGTFDAEQNSFTAADVTATDVEGYTKSEVTVNHETGAISVTYTLDKSALNDLLGDTNTLIYACDGFANSEFVTEDFDALLDETYVAWTTAQTALETVQTRSELNEALAALQEAYNTLNTAKEEAIAEMQGQLSDLITETDNLVESCYDGESFKYAGSFNVTEALITKTNEVLETATETRGSEFNAESYESALLNLTTAKQNLATAIAYATLPVQLTFDANSPVTYKITIDRTSTTVLAYDATSEMVAVTDFELGNKSHGWYFMATTDGKVRIMPYHNLNTTLALSTDDYNDGNSKVKGVAIGTDGYTQEWTIIANGDNVGWYNITCTNGTTTKYFSNHGGVNEKMGFYNNANDGGSLFKFEQISFDKSEAYYTLYNYYHSETKVASSEIQGDNAVGYYPETEAEAYNTAYGAATEALANSATTDAEYQIVYNNLVTANEALELNMPSADKFYRFVSVVEGDGSNVYANPADNKLYWSTDKATTDATAIWKITPSATEDFYNIGNLHTGSNINGFINYNPSPLSEEAGNIKIESLSYNDGQVGLKCNGTMMHAQDGGAIVNWGTEANDGSAWRIVEVDASTIKQSVSITKYEHAGLYLNYPVTIPNGVKAYYLDGSKISIDNEGVGTLKLTLIDDDVIPAETAVILYAPHGEKTVSYDFVYTDDPGGEYNNLFTGSAYQTYREAKSGHRYYVFGQNNGEIGLYKNGVKYKYNDEGTIIESVEGATHYKMSANKILFDWNENQSQSQGVNSFRFYIGNPTTTDIEDEVMSDRDVIYDLYGRRILEVVTSGFYIINGEKCYIRVK